MLKKLEPKCDGETLFGFTVKKCDQPATHLSVRNGTHEYYDFCDRHYYFYLHGEYADGAPGVPLFGDWEDGNGEEKTNRRAHHE